MTSDVIVACGVKNKGGNWAEIFVPLSAGIRESRGEHEKAGNASFCGWGGGGREWIRTTEDISQQIYSLPRLAASVPYRMRCFCERKGVL